MCGIAGSINAKLDQSLLTRYLRHRGPDDQRMWCNEQVTLFHARLSIQELSEAGAQPMQLDGLYVIFNGEIYNHQELRQKHGLVCNSHSDTETLLHLYRKLGIGMLTELDGMFAIALYDTTVNKLFLIRDRAGEKPIYYAANQKTLHFASELPWLQATLNPQIDKQRIANFLAVGYLPGSDTPYIGIEEVKPGSYIEFDCTTVASSKKQWWSIDPFYSNLYMGTYEEALEDVDRILMESVKRRLLSSDLEVGTFLSGGIDSGLVTAMASRLNQQLKTFTVSFEGAYNEAPLAALVANKLGTNHSEISISLDNLENDLENIFQNYGEPMMDDSIIPSYYVAKESKKHLTVILNGDAGDELFGGYRRYVPFTKMDLFRGQWSALARPLFKVLPSPKTKMNYYNYFYRLLNLLSDSGGDVYFSATNDLLHKHLDYFQIKPDLRHYPVHESREGNTISALQQAMKFDFNNLLPSILLVKMDIATMASSLEGRSPFLAKELLEFVPGLPDDFKIKNKTTKRILRDLAKRYLPQEIVDQPKRGFEIPLQDWVNNRLHTMIGDNLSSSSAFVKEILSTRTVDDLLNNRDKSIHPEQRVRLLFAMLSVECWKRGLSHN